VNSTYPTDTDRRGFDSLHPLSLESEGSAVASAVKPLAKIGRLRKEGGAVVGSEYLSQLDPPAWTKCEWEARAFEISEAEGIADLMTAIYKAQAFALRIDSESGRILEAYQRDMEARKLV